jgi:hypothetical protein
MTLYKRLTALLLVRYSHIEREGAKQVRRRKRKAKSVRFYYTLSTSKK